MRGGNRYVAETCISVQEVVGGDWRYIAITLATNSGVSSGLSCLVVFGIPCVSLLLNASGLRAKSVRLQSRDSSRSILGNSPFIWKA